MAPKPMVHGEYKLKMATIDDSNVIMNSIHYTTIIELVLLYEQHVVILYFTN